MNEKLKLILLFIKKRFVKLKLYAESNKKRSVIILASSASVIICSIILAVIFIPKKEDFSDYRNFDVEEIVEDGIIISGNPVDFEKLKKVNSDICAWIRIPGTNIDYPVLRSEMLEDEDFYLSHNYKKQECSSGAIYMQRINDETFIGHNTVLYGHDMLDGTMFADIKKYRKQEYLDKNSIVKIYTPKRILTFKIFSAYKTDDRHILDTYNFYDEASYNQFITDCTNTESLTKSVDKSILPKYADHLITLSTCTGRDRERFIAVGVLLSSVATK